MDQNTSVAPADAGAGSPAPAEQAPANAATEKPGLTADDLAHIEDDGDVDTGGEDQDGAGAELDDDNEAEADTDAAELLPAESAPEDPNELAAWRTERGIPETAEGYRPPKIEGFDWTPEDQPVLARLFEVAHANNLSAAATQALAKFYADAVAEHRARLEGLDQGDLTSLRETLKADLGDGYKPTMRQVKTYFTDKARFPAGFGEALLKARGPDGRLLVHHADFVPWARSISLDADPVRKAAERRAEILKIRDTNIGKYRHEKLDLELTELEAAGAGPVEVTRTPAELVAREAEIIKIRDTDIARYRREKLSDELADIHRKRRG